jgi:hypothetical protein
VSVETDIVTISITQDSVGLARAGFGVAMILSYNAAFSERLRYYEGKDDVAADFGTTSPEYRAATALFSQSAKPTRIAIGRGANKPTLKYLIGASAIRNSNTASYKINVVGEGFTDAVASYASDAATSAEEINSGLVTALNAVTGKNYVAALNPLVVASKVFTAVNATEVFTSTAHGFKNGDGPLQVSNSGGALPAGLAALTDYYVILIDANTFKLATTLANALLGTNLLISTDGTGTQSIASTANTVRPFDAFTVTGAAAGNWFSLELVDATALSSAETHVDPGVAADLDAIQLEQPDWYCLLTNYNSQAYALAAATWAESQTKIYIVDVPETGAIDTAVGSGTDTLTAFHTAAFGRSAGAYHHRPATFLAASWAGRVLPIDPGGDTWALKQLVGVSMPSRLTATNRTNLRARNANFITVAFGKNVLLGGTTADGDFIDVTRGLDWLNDDMTKGVGGILIGVDKVPYSDPGVTIVTNEVHASLDRAVRRGILRADPKPVVTAPKVADIGAATRGLRLLPDIKFSAETEGAIHKVAIAGQVSL